MIVVSGIKEVISGIRRLSKTDFSKLDMSRGKKYVSVLQEYLRKNKLGLTPIKPATVKSRISNLGGPLFDTGETARSATVKKKEGIVQAGFFSGDKTIRGKIDAAHLMIIHQEGRGNNPERDWLNPSSEKYEDEEDEKILEEFVNKMMDNF